MDALSSRVICSLGQSQDQAALAAAEAARIAAEHAEEERRRQEEERAEDERRRKSEAAAELARAREAASRGGARGRGAVRGVRGRGEWIEVGSGRASRWGLWGIGVRVRRVGRRKWRGDSQVGVIIDSRCRVWYPRCAIPDRSEDADE